MTVKPYIGWAVVFPRMGYMDGSSIRRTRSESIAAWLGNSPKSWAWWKRKHGLRCEKVVTRLA